MISNQDNTLAKLTDNELIRKLEALNAKEREITLSVLLYLIEIEKRRLYLRQGYSSLFDYCIRHFHYSESSAIRRIRTARCIRDFPEVYGMLYRGELNLCTVSRIAGILTEKNKEILLAETRNRSTRDVEMIVSRYRPGPYYRDRVRPVYIKRYIRSPGPASHAGTASHPEARVGTGTIPAPDDRSLAGAPGEGEFTAGAGTSGSGLLVPGNQAGAYSGDGGKKFTASAGGKGPETGGDGTSEGDAQDIRAHVALERRYKLEFTVNPGFIDKLRSIREMLSTKYPRGLEFEGLFELLMDEYLDRHGSEGRIRRREMRRAREKERGAPDGRPQNKKKSRQGLKSETKQSVESCGKNQNAPAVRPKKTKDPCQERPDKSKYSQDIKNKKKTKKVRRVNSIDNNLLSGKRRSRLIPRPVRDEVFKRDGGRCTFVSENGVRCVEKWNLQIDHIVPYARGGNNSADNLRLLCPDHNRLAAERIYGKDFMKRFYRRE